VPSSLRLNTLNASRIEKCEGVMFRLTFGAVPPTVRGRLVEESTISVIETRHAVSGKRLDGCQRSPRLSLCQAFCLREISLRTAVPTLKLAMRKQAVNDTLAALWQRQKERKAKHRKEKERKVKHRRNAHHHIRERKALKKRKKEEHADGAGTAGSARAKPCVT